MFCYIQDQVIHLTFLLVLQIKIGLDHNDPDTAFFFFFLNNPFLRFDLIREPKSGPGPVSQHLGHFFTQWAQQRSMWVQLWIIYHCFGIQYIKWPHLSNYIIFFCLRCNHYQNYRNLQVPTICTFTNLPKTIFAISYNSAVTRYWNILQI